MLTFGFVLTISVALIIAIHFLFGAASIKNKWDQMLSLSFECGFSSYFFSRFSFSVHYFMVGLIFLFLDLELCFLMPFFNENLNSNKLALTVVLFVIVLLMGLIMEWKEKALEWTY